MYNTLVYQPILNLLIWLYQVTGDNLGLAIIFLTLGVRGLLIPFTLPQMKSARKMAALKPQLDALKKKHGKNPKVLQKKQLEFYKKHGVNPAGGCLPFIAQFIVLIALYRVFMNTLKGDSVIFEKIHFLWLDLSAKDTSYVLPVLAGALQFLTSLTMLPGVENEPAKRKGSKKDKEDVAEMAQSMQQQMVYFMPLMTVFFAIQFPSGLALYWVVTTAFSFAQQLVISGPGGLNKYLVKIGINFKTKN